MLKNRSVAYLRSQSITSKCWYLKRLSHNVQHRKSCPEVYGRSRTHTT